MILVGQIAHEQNLSSMLSSLSVPLDCESLFLQIRDSFENEFCSSGLLSIYYKKSQTPGGVVDVKSMLKQLFVITEIVRLADAFETEYKAETGITDYKGNSVVLKLTQARSIGHLFGFAESLKL
mmetsp:Transcript_9107/g.13882  ORF Transcript_9107/g.13882 Transcript_9107/m.13882 type:complete len:124 (-) Transcript_9107:135-506(-)